MRAFGLVIAFVPLLLSGCLGGGSVESSTATTAARKVVVPSVEPGYLQYATSAIRAAGLRVVILSVPPISGADASVNGYAVQSQSPASGSRVPAGSPVVLQIGVSLNAGPGGVGPRGVVPNLVGMPVNLALSAAHMVGLYATVTGVPHQVRSDAVTTQSIAPDTPVEHNAIITLTMG